MIPILTLLHYFIPRIIIHFYMAPYRKAMLPVQESIVRYIRAHAHSKPTKAHWLITVVRRYLMTFNLFSKCGLNTLVLYLIHWWDVSKICNIHLASLLKVLWIWARPKTESWYYITDLVATIDVILIIAVYTVPGRVFWHNLS